MGMELGILEMTTICSIYHVSGSMKLTKIGFKCLTSLGMKSISFGNDGKISPGTFDMGWRGRRIPNQLSHHGKFHRKRVQMKGFRLKHVKRETLGLASVKGNIGNIFSISIKQHWSVAE